MGVVDCLRCGSCPECTRHQKSGRIRDHQLCAGCTAGIVGLPPLQLCKFDLTSIMIMAPIAIATMMEHVGDMSAISATVGENFPF